jgi:serine/threonine protein kinase
MLLVELTTLQLPYCETEFLDVKKRIVKGEIPNLSYILPHLQPLKEIIFKCLRFSPQERPTASELVKQLNEIKSTIQ